MTKAYIAFGYDVDDQDWVFSVCDDLEEAQNALSLADGLRAGTTRIVALDMPVVPQAVTSPVIEVQVV